MQLADPERHDELRSYVYGLIHHFRNDGRVQLWDVFNEPDNPNQNAYGTAGAQTELANKAEMATLLLKKVFVWARQADPSQPLTAGVWRGDWSSHAVLTPYNRVMLEESDVISFHCYADLSHVARLAEGPVVGEPTNRYLRVREAESDRAGTVLAFERIAGDQSRRLGHPIGGWRYLARRDGPRWSSPWGTCRRRMSSCGPKFVSR